MEIVLTILQVIASIALIAVVVFQTGKEAGLGALAGNTDTYMSKNQTGKDKLAAVTKWIAALWLILTLGLSLV